MFLHDLADLKCRSNRGARNGDFHVPLLLHALVFFLLIMQGFGACAFHDGRLHILGDEKEVEGSNRPSGCFLFAWVFEIERHRAGIGFLNAIDEA